MQHPRPLMLFVALAYGLSWLIWAPLWLPAFGVRGLPVVPFHHALGALGPITAAFVAVRMEGGAAGMADLARRMVRWRGRAFWVLLALTAPFLMLLLAVAAAWLLAGDPLTTSGIGVSSEFPNFSAAGFFLYNLFSFGYGEETGWRGYLLTRLQARHSALVATLLLTGIWALWHVPLFLYRPGYTSMGPGGVAGWLFSLLTGSVLLTWLFNESRGSILVVAVFHATIDIAFTSDVASPAAVNATGVLITLWGLAVLLLGGPRYLARRGKMVARPGGPRLRMEERPG